MSEEKRKVITTPLRSPVDRRKTVDLPDTAYSLWISGELDDILGIPDDYRVEVIGGEIVVSPAPVLEHGGIVHDISEAFVDARSRPNWPWTCLQGMMVHFMMLSEAAVPDLIVLDTGTFKAARQAEVRRLVPDQIEMVVEVTSKSNASKDRRPTAPASPGLATKWQRYAQAEIPYYFLVDRDPKAASSTLYTIPDGGTGAYLHAETWSFGDTVHLPEPFDLEISTEIWRAWN